MAPHPARECGPMVFADQEMIISTYDNEYQYCIAAALLSSSPLRLVVIVQLKRAGNVARALTPALDDFARRRG